MAACTSLELHQQKKKKTMRTMTETGRTKWETFTNGVAVKNSGLNEVGLCGWYVSRIG